MNTLYFIRHAESEANKARIMASQLAYPLTEEGRAEASLIAEELKDIAGIDLIISSPLKRAVQTAEPFSRVFSTAIELDERITEQHLGRFSGMGYDQVKLEPDYIQDQLRRWDWEPDGGGESYKMIADRVSSFFDDISEKYKNRNILIVTHAVTMRLIIATLKNILPDYPKDFPNNGEIIKVEFEGTGKEYSLESIFLGNSEKFTHNA